MTAPIPVLKVHRIACRGRWPTTWFVNSVVVLGRGINPSLVYRKCYTKDMKINCRICQRTLIHRQTRFRLGFLNLLSFDKFTIVFRKCKDLLLYNRMPEMESVCVGNAARAEGKHVCKQCRFCERSTFSGDNTRCWLLNRNSYGVAPARFSWVLQTGRLVAKHTFRL